jgi:hypothetical protein
MLSILLRGRLEYPCFADSQMVNHSSFSGIGIPGGNGIVDRLMFSDRAFG